MFSFINCIHSGVFKNEGTCHQVDYKSIKGCAAQPLEGTKDRILRDVKVHLNLDLSFSLGESFLQIVNLTGLNICL